MSNISRIISACWGILCLGVVAALMMVYANFPVQANWQLPEQLGSINLNKERFFYMVVGSFLAFNILYYSALNLMDSLKIMTTPKVKQYSFTGVRLSLKIQVIGFNIFLVCFMIFLKMTSTNAETGSGWYLWLFFIGPLIMIMGLGYMLYWLILPQKSSS